MKIRYEFRKKALKLACEEGFYNAVKCLGIYEGFEVYTPYNTAWKDNPPMIGLPQLILVNEKEAKFTGAVPVGKVMVDGLGVGDVGNIVLRDRQHLSQDGLIVIVMTMDTSTGEIVAGPDVISRGFVYVKESENLMDDVKKVIREEVQILENKGITDWVTIKSTLKDHIRDYIFQKTKRNPMILPIIMSL